MQALRDKISNTDWDKITGLILNQHNWEENEQKYWNFHIRRFKHIICKLDEIFDRQQSFRVLDIGPSFQTLLINEVFVKAKIDVLGFPLTKYTPKNAISYSYDLNENYYKEKLPTVQPEPNSYDLIVFTEVIEHLHTPPENTLQFINSLLKPEGKLILQTPNAVFFGNRLKILLGQNPFQKLRADRNNPGHYREYTAKELSSMLSSTGFVIDSMEGKNYFAHEGKLKKMFNYFISPLPKEYQAGFTIICHKAITQQP